MSEKLVIRQGETFNHVIMWATSEMVYKPISAIPSVAPLRLTVVSHELVTDVPVAVTAVKGMVELNAEVDEDGTVDESAYVPATRIDQDTIELNSVNGAGFKPYVSGGYIQYRKPVDLSSYPTARMTIKDRVGGTVLMELTSATGDIVISNTTKKITVVISDEDTAAITWKRGVYDLEVEAYDGTVVRLDWGTVEVSREITT